MKKILTIARREFQAMVATKAFLIGIAMMPILMLGGTWIPGLLKGMEKSEDRRIAIIDGSGQLFVPLKLAAEQRNKMLQTVDATKPDTINRNGESVENGDAATAEKPLSKQEDEDRQTRKAMGLEEIHRYILEEIPAEGFDDEKRLEL